MSENPGADVPVKRMRLRYAGRCAECSTALDAGVMADYDRQLKVVRCVTCPTPPNALGWVDGVAGASAAEEYERRSSARQERVQANHPRIGKLLLAVFDDPQSTRAWERGSEGERVVGESLQRIASDTLRVLHDRRVPGSRANIDHVAVASTGVYVIDAKRYVNQRPSLRVEGGMLAPRRERLLVGGRDRTKLVEGLHKQVLLVREALADQPDVAVRGVLCFIEADWPLVGGPFSVQGVDVVHPRRLSALLTQPGDLDPERIATLQLQLHEVFPRS